MLAGDLVVGAMETPALTPDIATCTEFSVSKLPPDLRDKMRLDSSKTNKQELFEQALRCLLDKQNRRIPLSDIVINGHRLATELRALDDDKDEYLSYDELLRGLEVMVAHRKRARQLACAVFFLSVFAFLMLGGIFGLVYFVVDIHKDTQAIGGKLVSRTDGSPLQVASAEYFIQDGALMIRSSQLAIPAPNTSQTVNISSGSLSDPNPSKPLTLNAQSNDGTNVVKTAQVGYSYDQIHSALSNDIISKITHLTISGGLDANAPFIRTNIDTVIRIPGMMAPGDGSILLILSSAGRFVVNGTNVLPAEGDLASMNISELYEVAVTKPLQKANGIQVSPLFCIPLGLTFCVYLGGRRNVACTRTNKCNNNKAKRRDETQCCYGQLYLCSFSNSPQTVTCSAGEYCAQFGTNVVRNQCSDMQLTLRQGHSDYANSAGLYILDADTWNGYPIYHNKQKQRVMAYSGSVNGGQWVITSDAYMVMIKSDSASSFGGFEGNRGTNPFTGWEHFEATYTGSTTYGIHCPGHLAKVPTDSPSKFVYYSPPYLRMCAEGYYCPNTVAQLLCDDLIISVVPGGSDYASCAGTYRLSTSLVLNGFPVYVNNEKARFLGLHPWGVWGITGTQWLNDIIRNQGSFGAFNWQNSWSTDPKTGWNQYSVTYAGTRNYDCPYGTMLPKP